MNASEELKPDNTSSQSLTDTLLYGGSFNPIHNGHLACVTGAAEALGLNRILLMPCGNPPHKAAGDLLDVQARIDLCRAGIHRTFFPYKQTIMHVSDYEYQSSLRGEKSYTYNTILGLKKEANFSGKINFLIGEDTVPHIATWHRWQELLDEIELFVVRRPGCEYDKGSIPWRVKEAIDRHWPDVPTFSVSSTHIREQIRKGRSIRFLVPDAVESLIKMRGYYR